MNHDDLLSAVDFADEGIATARAVVKAAAGAAISEMGPRLSPDEVDRLARLVGQLLDDVQTRLHALLDP